MHKEEKCRISRKRNEERRMPVRKYVGKMLMQLQATEKEEAELWFGD